MKSNIFKNVMPPPTSSSTRRNKITIIGSGTVGTAIAFALATQQIANEVFVWDRNDDRVAGEILDIKCGLGFSCNVKVNGGSDLSLSANSKVVVIAAGARKLEGESTKDLVQRNIEIVGKWIPKIVYYSPDAVILVVTSPSDIVAFAVWKLSGFPKHKIIGIGNHLHTMLLRSLIADQLELNVTSVNAMLLGEQGEKSIPVMENFGIAGVKFPAECESQLQDVIHEVTKYLNRIRNLKGFTQWSIALACTDIIKSIVNDSNDIKVIATMVKGIYGISKEVFMSVPCLIGSSGVSAIVDTPLSSDDQQNIRKSSHLLDEIQKLVNY